MDAFQRAVDDARRQLGLIEGRQVSVSELLRMAGFPERPPAEGGLSIKGARYHLDPSSNRLRKGGHRVPAELVQRLAAVLPISQDELSRAAQVAAGFTVEIDGDPGQDIPTVLARYLGDEDVSEDEKRETTARLLQIIAEQQGRARHGRPGSASSS